MNHITKNRVFIVVVLLILSLSNALELRSKNNRYDREEIIPFVYPELPFFPKIPPSDNEPSIEGADLGRHLFYDPVLSADSTMSCATCHRQEGAFSDSPNQYSSGVHGNLLVRNTMPLFNLLWYPSMFWDGRVESIEAQVLFPVSAHDEMDLDWVEAERRLNSIPFYKEKFLLVFGVDQIDSVLVSKAIGQFERTLLSFNSKYDRVIRGEDYFTSDEYDGFVLINDQTKGDCLHCHTTDGNALGTTTGFSNNGLDSVFNAIEYADKGRAGHTDEEKDLATFRIPSLRNLLFTAPYMHDGRFKNLEEVLDFYSTGVHQSLNVDSKMQYAYQGGVNLTSEEKRKILLFLACLSDTVFVTNPSYASPFE